MQATEMDPLHATVFANWSLCWLRMGEGNLALADAAPSLVEGMVP